MSFCRWARLRAAGMKTNAKTFWIVLILLFSAGASVILSRAVRARDGILADSIQEKQHLDRLRAQNRRLKMIRVDAAELDRLRRENAELPKLRGELQRLQDTWKAQNVAEPVELTQLRAENEQLQQQKRDLQALPNRATCIHNLQLIDAAKNQFVQDNGLITGEPVSPEQLAPY